MQRLFPCLLLALPLLGQYETLSTSDDGSVVYFTSKLRQRGTNQNEFYKVFAADSTGVRLVLQRDRETRSDPSSAWPVTTYYSLEGVDTSGDARLYAVQGRRDCGGGSGCLNVVKWQTDITDARGAIVRSIPGRAVLSRNGRYALTCCTGAMIDYQTGLTDLETGEQASAPSTASRRPAGRAVSSTGVAVVVNQGAVTLLTTKDTRKLDTPTATDCTIDDTASTVACATAGGLIRIDVETGRHTTVSPSGTHPALSADGRTFAYLRNGDLFVNERRLPRVNNDDPVLDFTLSGDGRVAWTATAGGALIRHDLPTNTATAVIPRALQLFPPSYHPVPQPVAGSRFPLRGRGFQPGASVFIGDRPAPVLTNSPTELLIQIPWGIASPAQQQPVRVVNPEPSFFEEDDTHPAYIGAAYPQFERTPNEMALAAHAEWDGLITRERPARPGEIIHVAMTGLGPVTITPADGEPAPLDRIVPITGPLECTVGRTPADVLFAGLMPGTVGLYQLDLRIPSQYESFSGGLTFLLCYNGVSSDSVTLPIIPAP